MLYDVVECDIDSFTVHCQITLTLQCRNHSHGPYPPGFGRHGVCAHENKELAKAREALPLIEDSSNCDIVKAAQ